MNESTINKTVESLRGTPLEVGQTFVNVSHPQVHRVLEIANGQVKGDLPDGTVNYFPREDCFRSGLFRERYMIIDMFGYYREGLEVVTL